MNKLITKLSLKEKIGYSLGDTADYSEWKTGRRSTGLVFSAVTFAQKEVGELEVNWQVGCWRFLNSHQMLSKQKQL
jgi:Na+/melibiose symporter-like transporter